MKNEILVFQYLKHENVILCEFKQDNVIHITKIENVLKGTRLLVPGCSFVYPKTNGQLTAIVTTLK